MNGAKIIQIAVASTVIDGTIVNKVLCLDTEGRIYELVGKKLTLIEVTR